MRYQRLHPLFLAIAISFGGNLSAEDVDFEYPPTITLEAVRTWIDKADVSHPRLLTTKMELVELRKSLDADPTRRLLADAVIHRAELLSDVAPVERRLEGRRLLGVSRTCLQRVITLAMAYHLTGEDRFVDRCREEMLAAARFSDWNPSHFLDVGEMTLALAIGYDWLYEPLDASTREQIRTAILEKGVTLPFETKHRGWVRASNNWGQVCHGGLTAGALAVLEDEPELAAKTVHNALQNVTRSMAAFAPVGSYPEGPGYWAYGTSYNVVLIGVLESALGTDFGLRKAPGFDQTGQYPALVTGPSGEYFNYADGGAGRSPQPVLFWFASRYDRPDWLHGEREFLNRYVSTLSRSNAASYGGRLLPLALLWMKAPVEQQEIQIPLHWYGRGETPITVHRSSWAAEDTTYIGFKAGSPSASHGQMDIGSFVLDADGVRWGLDLGSEGYHGIESRGMNLWGRGQDSDRWTIFRQQNHGHNTLVIDGQLQRAAGSAEIVEFSDNPEFPHSIADLSDVYKDQAEQVHRGIAMLPSREVLIQDRLTGLQPGSRVRWGMITRGAVSNSAEGKIELTESDSRLQLRVLSPAKSKWQVIDTATPRNPWDSANRGTSMVAFEAITPDSGELTLAVLATPGSCAESAVAEIKIHPLDQW